MLTAERVCEVEGKKREKELERERSTINIVNEYLAIKI